MKRQEMDLKRELECYQIPLPDQKRKEQCQKQLQELKLPYQMTDGQFILGQLRFMKPRTWLGQLLVLVVFMVMLWSKYVDYMQLSLLSVMTPLFLVFHIEELARVCNKSMLEIELATKHSLKKLILSRLCILGITDFVMMCGWILFLNSCLKESLFGILLYSLVPFNITVMGMLYLLKYSGKGTYAYQALSYTIFVCVCFIVIPQYKPLIYSSSYQDIWLLAYVVSLFLLVKSIKELFKNIAHRQDLWMTEG